MKKSPFIHTDPVIPPMFAGRDNEIYHINRVLFEDRESIALFGNDAIGKSSIIKTVYSHLLANKSTKVLPVALNSFDFLQAVQFNFLGIITHQICAAIWTKLMNRNYSELIEDSLINFRGNSLILPEEVAVKRIFKILSSDKLSGIGKVNKEIGGKFFIEGKLSSEAEFSSERKPLAPFEFLHLLDELLDIIKSYGYDSLLLICDELNHYPHKVNSEFLRSYFDIFSSRKIQFLITIVNPSEFGKEDADLLLDSFNKPLEIKHFTTIESVQQLVLNVLLLDGEDVYFEKETFKILFDLTDGHPWWIQKICDSAFKEVMHHFSDKIITSDIIIRNAEFYSNEIEIYNRQIKSGQNFRRFHLGNGSR